MGKGRQQKTEPKVEEIPNAVPEEDHAAVKEAMAQVHAVESQLGRMRRGYLKTEAELNTRLDEVERESRSLIRLILKRLGLPDDWVLNADTMTFQPRSIVRGIPVAPPPAEDDGGNGVEPAAEASE